MGSGWQWPGIRIAADSTLGPPLLRLQTLLVLSVSGDIAEEIGSTALYRTRSGPAELDIDSGRGVWWATVLTSVGRWLRRSTEALDSSPIAGHCADQMPC